MQTNVAETRDNTVFFWGATVAYFLLIFAKGVLGVNIPSMLFLIISSLMFLFFNTKQGIAFAIAFSLLNTSIQIAYALAVGLLVLLLKNFFNVRISKYYLPIVLLMLWESFHLFISPSSISEYIRYLIIYAYLAIIVCDKKLDINHGLIIWVYVVSSMFVCFITMLQTLHYTGFSFSGFVVSGIRLGYAQQLSKGNNLWLLSYDPNLLGQNISLAIACLALMLWKGYHKILCVGLILVFLIFGLLTLSKTFILSMLLMVLYIYFSNMIINRKSVMKSVLTIAGLAILLLIVYFTINCYFNNAVNNVISRFSTEDLTTGRVFRFTKFNEYLASNIPVLLFGIGLQDISSKTGIIFSPHTSLQEVLICWGLIGLVIVFVMVYFMILNAKERSIEKPSLINYLPFWIFLFMSQSTQLFRLRDRVLLFILVFACMLQENKERERAEIKPSH